MSQTNALAGLIGSYGESDDENDAGGDGPSVRPPLPMVQPEMPPGMSHAAAAVHPAPIPHCPWSACYDDTSGFTYYWNQQTNAVTWDAPPEYLLALKVAQQQLSTSRSTEVSAEEWQLYQQALAEKQKKTVKPVVNSSAKPINKNVRDLKHARNNPKRSFSDEEDVKIELITSYYNSDSDSNEEAESPVKTAKPTPPVKPALPVKPVKPKSPPLPKHPHKKQKTKPTVTEYGPSLPPNQNYSMPIGPELPPTMSSGNSSPIILNEDLSKDEEKSTNKAKQDDDENTLLNKLKDKTKLLQKLGGEIPSDLQKLIQDESRSLTSSPKILDESSKDSKVDNIDDLLEEIEKKELPKSKSKKIDMFGDESSYKSADSGKSSPRSGGRSPKEEFKPLFPSSKTIVEEPIQSPSQSVSENGVDKLKPEIIAEKKGPNLYLSDPTETVPPKKKLRISNSVLPERKVEQPSYTTKYSQHIEGFSSERTGLGFSKDDDDQSSTKNTFNYGNGLTFTKGETLNEEKKDEDLDDLMDLVEAKLKFLNELQPCTVTPVQEMLIQMQTLACGFRAGALSRAYWRRWCAAAGAALRTHERAAAPPGWTAAFQRSEGRYRYVRLSDGLTQWEYPAVANCDMDISTTPPHPGIESQEPPAAVLPPLPPPRTPPPPPPPAWRDPPRAPPRPPAWRDPPPPGVDDPAPPQPPLPPEPPKQEIGEELMSFYNDIAELEKTNSQSEASPSVATPPAGNSPERPPPPPPPVIVEKERDRPKEKVGKVSKKKSKVKISSSIGMNHKSVSNLVAKWQQVAEEINSD